MPGGVRVSGLYQVSGQTVTVNLVLARDGKKIANLTIQGAGNNLPALAKSMTDQISAAVAAAPR